MPMPSHDSGQVENVKIHAESSMGSEAVSCIT